MKLATLDDGSPDGRLLVVSRDLSRAAPARAAATMQDALDRWTALEDGLRTEANEVEDGAGEPLDREQLLAAMPRAFQFLDASAFLAHNHILAEAWGYDRRQPDDPPLMYQGLSDRFYPAHGSVPFRSADDRIDFEAEFGVLTDRVPLGIGAARALSHVRLLVVLNDWSLRAFGPGEMKGGFGFLHAKPASAMSAFAITPDELDGDWRDGRIVARLEVRRNDELFGRPEGGAMSFGFGELIAHAAATRDLCAGTVLGSGTVANYDAAVAGSACIAERIALDRIAGRSATPYLSFGERVTITCTRDDGDAPFGSLDHVLQERSSA